MTDPTPQETPPMTPPPEIEPSGMPQPEIDPAGTPDEVPPPQPGENDGTAQTRSQHGQKPGSS